MGKVITRVGDMLEMATEGHIVHGCNAQGSMGKGIALSIKKKWPIVNKEYVRYVDGKCDWMGKAIPVVVEKNLIVWNAITQEYYKGHKKACPKQTRFVSYEAIEKAFTDITEVVLDLDDVPKIIHIPLIGAGLGGGDWDIIKEIIERVTKDITVILWVLN